MWKHLQDHLCPQIPLAVDSKLRYNIEILNLYKYLIQSQNCIILHWILLTQVITILHNLCHIAKLTLKQHGQYPASSPHQKSAYQC